MSLLGGKEGEEKGDPRQGFGGAGLTGPINNCDAVIGIITFPSSLPIPFTRRDKTAREDRRLRATSTCLLRGPSNLTLWGMELRGSLRKVGTCCTGGALKRDGRPAPRLTGVEV